jgi:hypothetical protein
LYRRRADGARPHHPPPGAVYPLSPDNAADIAGDSWEIEDCNRFLLAGTDIPYAPTGDGRTAADLPSLMGEWTVETNRFGHHVLFNASERVARTVVDALESAGLSVQRWDVSHRAADDGRFYDWFARLRFKGSREECAALIDAVFAKREAPAVPPSTKTAHVEDFDSRVEHLVDEVTHLRTRLVSAETNAADLLAQLQRSRANEAMLTADLDRASAHQRSMHDQLDELRRSAGKEADLQTLLRAHTETEELLEMALAENADLHQQLAQASGMADQHQGQVAVLEADLAGVQTLLEELSERERERRRANQTRKAPPAGAAGFLSLAFSRLELLQDSIDVLTNFEAPASALRVLVQLDMGQVIGKDVEGLRGWREVAKVATGIPGSEDMGRIYYKPDSGRVMVSVHVKQDDKEQRRHLERLRQL